MRAAIRQRVTTPTLHMWALWLADRFDGDGDLHRADRAALARWSKITLRSVSRYLAELERLGLIEREQTARLNRRTGHYDRVVIIRIAGEFRAAQRPKSPVIAKRAPDQPKGQQCPSVYLGCSSSSGSVGERSSRRNARAREAPEPAIDDDARRVADEQWPLMARSRTDLPGQRPGYSTNATRDRWADGGEPWSPEPAPPPRKPIEPALAALINDDPREAMRQMLGGFGRLPDDVESRQR